MSKTKIKQLGGTLIKRRMIIKGEKSILLPNNIIINIQPNINYNYPYPYINGPRFTMVKNNRLHTSFKMIYNYLKENNLLEELILLIEEQILLGV